MARRLSILAVLVAAVLLPAAPAEAAARVSVSPGTVDPTYATTIRVSGSGFQSVEGGHGGIYVFFGTVKPGWQPSRGGATGADYLYVPDSEAKDNQGFQRYVAFPGSDTASSANGGTMSAAGAWSTQLVVPGATFQAYDRSGNVTTVDCRKVTCGVITVGAHGVANSHNETFTPVSIGTASSQPSSTSTATAAPSADPTSSSDPSEEPSEATDAERSGPAELEVDRASAVAGHVLAFTASGLPAGSQVSAVFDDGAAGAGPFLVGADGTLTGVITLPANTPAGTHELRLYGVDDPPSVMFAVQAAEAATAADVETSSAADSGDTERRAAWLFAGGAALLLVVALARLGLLWRRKRAA